MPAGPDPAQPERVAPFNRRHWQALAAITAVGVALRFWCLGEWSIWVDEAHTFRDAGMQFGGETGFLATNRAYYPTTFLLLRLLFGVGALGYDEASLRLPFVLFGAATVPALAVCGRALVGAWPAVVAAAMLAINPWHVFWSQNARGYAMAVLFAVVAMHRAWLWLDGGGRRDLWLAVVALAVAVSCHPTTICLVVGFVAFVAVRRVADAEPGRRKWVVFAAVSAAALLLLPWMVRELLPFDEFLASKASPSLPHFVQTVAYYFRPPVLLVAAVALLVAPAVLGRGRAMFLGCLAVAPMLAFAAVAALLAKTTARYAIATLPVFTWLAGVFVVALGARLARAEGLPRRAALGFAALVPFVIAFDYARLDVAYFGAQHGQRAQWREAVRFVEAEAERRGFAGVLALTANEPTLLYYLRPRHWFVTDGDPHPDDEVYALVRWSLYDGLDGDERRLHAPGVDAHIAWQTARAAAKNQLLAVLVKLPELREEDVEGTFERALARDFELALHLPCWVGPKDESIYVYLPKR